MLSVPYESRPLSLTPAPSGHCLLTTPEPLSGGINPFLTPGLRLGVWYPREGTVSGGASRLHRAHSNHVTEARWGSWSPRGPGTAGTDKDFFLFHQLLQGEPPALLPSRH